MTELVPYQQQSLQVRESIGLEKCTPQERALFAATKGQRFKEYPNFKAISVAITPVIADITKDVGYRGWGQNIGEDARTLLRLAEILQLYYENFTINDIRQAFTCLIAGDLDGYLPKRADGQADRDHYQQFNIEYICKILRAYRVYRAELKERVENKIPRPEQQRDLQQERIYHDAIRTDFVGAFKIYRETGKLMELSPAAEILFYRFLEGYAPEIGTESDRELLDEAFAFYTRDMQREKILARYRNKRREAIKAGFQKIIDSGIDIETLKSL